jgi:hypothetical protein
MNTIALKPALNVTFKRTQILPRLAPEMADVPRESSALFPSVATMGPHQKPAAEFSSSSRHQLPCLQPEGRKAKQRLVMALTLSGAFLVGYAFALTFNVFSNWPNFTAWVAHLLH